MKVRPKKHLGQHFLKDPAIAERIAEAVPWDEAFPIVEIGPGTGALTQPLHSKWGDRLWLLDIDPESVQYLKLHFPDIQSHILEEDFLKWLPIQTDHSSLHVVGNFPYNISSQIVFSILEHREKVISITGMFQKEVAQRLCSPPGGKTYGILSVLLQCYFDVEYLFTVKEGVFHPPPKVKSGVIRALKKRDLTLPVDYDFLKKVVKAAFNQRRKTLLNALQLFNVPKSVFERNQFAKLRAEQLSVSDFIDLAVFIKEHQK